MSDYIIKIFQPTCENYRYCGKLENIVNKPQIIAFRVSDINSIDIINFSLCLRGTISRWSIFIRYIDDKIDLDIWALFLGLQHFSIKAIKIDNSPGKIVELHKKIFKYIYDTIIMVHDSIVVLEKIRSEHIEF